MTNTKLEEIPATLNLPNSGLIFSKEKGGGTFEQLRKFNYGPGFRMSTIPELVQLFYSYFENEKYPADREVRCMLGDYFIAGNTATHYFNTGVFVEDFPEVEKGKIVTPNRGKLEKRLGRTEERGVIFSDDRLVRFVPYGFAIGLQSSLELAKNPGIIALTGSEENAEKLAEVARHYDMRFDLYFANNENLSKSGVAVIYSKYLNQTRGYGLLDRDTPAVGESSENPNIISIDAAAFEKLDGFGASFGILKK
jgi:hypothetical protein